MATFKTTVRKPRTDGLFPVYIRVTHNRKIGYVKTDKVVSSEFIDKNGDIKDPVVNEHCSHLIREYTDRENRVNSSQWSLKEVIDHITKEDVDVCFSEYAEKHWEKIKSEGRERTSKNYKLAVQHLERYLGTNRIMFSHLTSVVLNRWIESLRLTNRAKEMYPVCIRQIFKSAILDFNDEERGVVRIKFNPWLKVQIPKADKGIQRAISAEECREFFNRPLPKTKMISSLPELGRDIALLVLCLGGINTVDLFEMKKSNYKNGKICYNRAKTRNHRADDAYMEMRIEPYIQPIFDKYLDESEGEYLFNFHERYCDSDSFSANVNSGIRKICKDMEMSKENYYCVYTFRHTWGTIAQNDCGANLHDVAFGMNHSHGLKVTRGYVKIDYSPAWELNAKIIDFIFFSNEKSKQGLAKDIEETKDAQFRITPKMMIKGEAFFMGEKLVEITDIGYHTVDDVINVLTPQLPSDIAKGCMVQFRITNMDSKKYVIYERSKGKGF